MPISSTSPRLFTVSIDLHIGRSWLTTEYQTNHIHHQDALSGLAGQSDMCLQPQGQHPTTERSEIGMFTISPSKCL